jgi:hypothetical protein
VNGKRPIWRALKQILLLGAVAAFDRLTASNQRVEFFGKAKFYRFSCSEIFGRQYLLSGGGILRSSRTVWADTFHAFLTALFSTGSW